MTSQLEKYFLAVMIETHWLLKIMANLHKVRHDDETNIEMSWFMSPLSYLPSVNLDRNIFSSESHELFDDVNEAIISPDHSWLSVTQWASLWPAPLSLRHFSSRLF